MEVLKGRAAFTEPWGFLLFLVFYAGIGAWPLISEEALSL